MQIGRLLPGEPGVFRSLLLPDMADALAAGDPVTALALTQDDIAIGAIAGYMEDDCFQINSLYVAPDYRRCGGGRMLLETLFGVLDGLASGVEISFTVTKEEHETLLPFLDAMGFEQEADNGKTLYITTLGEAVGSPFFASAAKKAGTPFSQLSESALSLVQKTAQVSGAPLPEQGLFAKTVERDLSVVHFNGSNPDAFVAIDKTRPDELTLAAAWSGSKNPVVLPSLLRSAVTSAREKYPPETRVAVQAVNSASVALIRALLPEAVGISHTYHRSLDTWM